MMATRPRFTPAASNRNRRAMPFTPPEFSRRQPQAPKPQPVGLAWNLRRSLYNRFDYTNREDSGFLASAMGSKENPDVPAGYLLEEITAGENGVVTLWRSPDGKNHVWTFDGKIRKEIERYARRHGITFDNAARALAEAVFDWMKR